MGKHKKTSNEHFFIRFGTALVFEAPGEINLRKKAYEEDFSPIDPNCPCPTCQNYTRAYLHSIVTKAECVTELYGTKSHTRTGNSVNCQLNTLGQEPASTDQKGFVSPLY